MLGVDYSTPTRDARRLKRAGAGFVCRYLSTVNNPKNITKQEVKALKAEGLQIVLVFETVASRAKDGYAAGADDAISARGQSSAVGLAFAPIYFAVDFDAYRASDLMAANEYIKGAASVLGKENTGVYGGYWTVNHVLNQGSCKYAWQTYAWSGGRLDRRAHIHQVLNGQFFAGLNVDFDRSLKPDFGQALPHLPTPRPRPKPWHYPEDGAFWTWLRWRLGEGEFQGHAHDPSKRPHTIPRVIPSSWWIAAARFLTRRNK